LKLRHGGATTGHRAGMSKLNEEEGVMVLFLFHLEREVRNFFKEEGRECVDMFQVHQPKPFLYYPNHNPWILD
jgi:hypothetical protein